MRQETARLRWRCRRGMRELDVLLERYFEQRYPSAPAAEQQAFEALLDLPDPQLYAFVMRRESPADPEWVHVIAKLTDPKAINPQPNSHSYPELEELDACKIISTEDSSPKVS